MKRFYFLIPLLVALFTSCEEDNRTGIRGDSFCSICKGSGFVESSELMGLKTIYKDCPFCKLFSGGKTTPPVKDDPKPPVRIDPPRQVNVWIDCTGCYGSGNCSTCNGLGWIFNPSERYYLQDYKQECPSCKGRKICQFCGDNVDATKLGINNISYRPFRQPIGKN